MSSAAESPCWLALWPHVREQLAGRRETVSPARLLAVEPGRAYHITAPIDPAGPILPDWSDSLLTEPRAWPVAAATIDLVAGCDLAAAGRTAATVAEAARVLTPGGCLILRDRIVPGSTRRGRLALQQQAAGAYLNALARLRDGRHQDYLSHEQWLVLLVDHGFRLAGQEETAAALVLDGWLAGTELSDADAIRLEVMLRQAPAEVADFLQINWAGRQLHFHWPELLLIAVHGA